MSSQIADYSIQFFIYSFWILSLAYGQDFSLNNLHTLTERLWLYNNDMACPTNVSSRSFLADHPGYFISTHPEQRQNESITVATIWVRLPQGDVLFVHNVPSTFLMNFLCNPSMKSPIEKCAIGNCLLLLTTDDQLEQEKRTSQNTINVTSSDACNHSRQLSLGIVPKQCLSLPPRESYAPNTGSLVIFIITLLLTILILYFVCGTCCNYISGLRGSDSIPHINCIGQMGGCLRNIWYRIKCCYTYRGPYQEI